ncbi:MAG: hypothetical protein ACOVNY_02735, partial [Chitinophagaceae bacterium]
MKKTLWIALCICFYMQLSAQTLQSPEKYLGYKIGTKYTRHHKVVEYFKSVSSAKPDMVKT